MYKNIEDARAYARQYMKERRAWYHEHGLCAECGKEDARTMIGKYICFDCYERKNGHMPEVNIEPKKKRKYVYIPKHGIPRSAYAAHGPCSICGSAPPIDGRRICQKCYDDRCKAAWASRKSKGVRPLYPPLYDTEKAKAAYQYCLDHRQEYIERWKAEYDCEYEEYASAKGVNK